MCSILDINCNCLKIKFSIYILCMYASDFVLILYKMHSLHQTVKIFNDNMTVADI